MLFLYEASEEVQACCEEIKLLLEGLLDKINCVSESIIVQPVENKLCLEKFTNSILIVEEGMVTEYYNGKQLRIYETYDLLNFEKELDSQIGILQYKSEFPVKLIRYDQKEFINALIEADCLLEWEKYISLVMTIKSLAICELLPSDASTPPQIKCFSEGECIIKEGDPSQDVYTMLEGHAEVSTSDTIVGEVCMNEIFGAFAALTDSPRIASVTATKKCMVMVQPKDEFIFLIKSRPHTVLTLIQQLANKIAQLNEKIVTLKK